MATKEWKPSKSDIEWTRNLFDMLNKGGYWGTSYAMYQKVSEKKVALVQINAGFQSDDRLGMLDRTKKAIRAAGYEYIEETDV